MGVRVKNCKMKKKKNNNFVRGHFHISSVLPWGWSLQGVNGCTMHSTLCMYLHLYIGKGFCNWDLYYRNTKFFFVSRLKIDNFIIKLWCIKYKHIFSPFYWFFFFYLLSEPLAIPKKLMLLSLVPWLFKQSFHLLLCILRQRTVSIPNLAH